MAKAPHMVFTIECDVTAFLAALRGLTKQLIHSQLFLEHRRLINRLDSRKR
jgi:hypothetical protein